MMMPDKDSGISSATVESLTAECQRAVPLIVVDIGTGTGRSAAVLAKHTPENAVVFTIENDAAILEKARSHLEASLSKKEYDKLQWIHAPLRGRWYDPEKLSGLPDGIQFLFVDGPQGKQDRSACLPLLHARLSKEATILLDDAKRWTERRIIEKWKAFFESKGMRYQFKLLPTDRGLGVFWLS